MHNPYSLSKINKQFECNFPEMDVIVPRCLFDTNNNEDRKLIEMLKQLYRESNQEDQAIPEGLFDLTSEEERRECIDRAIWEYTRNRIEYKWIIVEE